MIEEFMKRAPVLGINAWYWFYESELIIDSIRESGFSHDLFCATLNPVIFTRLDGYVWHIPESSKSYVMRESAVSALDRVLRAISDVADLDNALWEVP